MSYSNYIINYYKLKKKYNVKILKFIIIVRLFIILLTTMNLRTKGIWHILSDVHLEFFDKKKVDKLIDIMKNKLVEKDTYLMLAGDLCGATNNNLEYFLSNIKNQFRKIFYVMGNHEFYNTSLLDGKKLIRDKINILNNDNNNIILLDNETYFLEEENTVIIGSTLWSDLSYNESLDLYDVNNISTAKRYLNDFNYINEYTPQDYQKEFEKSKSFIQNKINENRNRNIIVLTHHMPSYKLIDSKYKGMSMNRCFASKLDDLFDDSIICWIYGHTHKPNDIVINNIRFKCNSIGYIGENESFKLIEKIEL